MQMMYHVPYFDEDDRDPAVHVMTVYSENKLTLPEVLQQFYKDISYGYVDDDYQLFSPEELLQIAVEQLNIRMIDIHCVDHGKVTRGSWRTLDAYRSLKRIREVREYIESQKEIKLSSHALYGQHPLYWDDVMINMEGTERFLFTYSTPEEEEELPKFEDDDLYEVFSTGIETYRHDTFEIQDPLLQEEDILKLFPLWAKQVGLMIEGKMIRLSQRHEFEFRPMMDNLREQMEQDPDHIFTIPSQYFFGFMGNEIPPKEELLESLQKEKPGTIACVIDDFKDDTLLYFVNSLKDEQKKDEVIKLLPRVPCKSLKFRLRYATMFTYHSDYVEERIRGLQDAYTYIMQQDKTSAVDEDIIAEYEFWKKIQQP